MGLIGNIINITALLLPPILVWLYFGRKKKQILNQPAETKIQIAHRNQDLKDWKAHYQETFAKFVFPAIIFSSLLSVGDSVMDKKDKHMSVLKSELDEIKQEHGERIKNIENYLFPPGGPGGPTIFQRMDSLEKSREDLEGLMLRVTDPDPELRKMVEELQQQITLLRQEIDELKIRLVPTKTQGFMEGGM
ncbi:hypothetical protein [Oceanisphaera sp. KMM 10153]|uniref:hypothetical protein n=1 Tax=Oceanisphaera submarina TaxID=3390193 RepID=UPI0039758831